MLTKLVAFYHAIPTPLVMLALAMLGNALLKYLPKVPDLTTAAFGFLGKMIAKLHPGYVQGLLTRVNSYALALVLKTENTAIEDIKSAVINGSLSVEALPGALRKVKADVLADLSAAIKAQGLWKDLVWLAFGGNADALAAHLDTTIEAHVSTLPTSGLQSKAGNGTLAATHIAAAQAPAPRP